MDLAKATLNFNTHSVNITVDEEGSIFCFKYIDTRCDWDIFDNQIDAAEYIVEPFKPEYRLILRGDTEH